jgi:hypothetical protein
MNAEQVTLLIAAVVIAGLFFALGRVTLARWRVIGSGLRALAVALVAIAAATALIVLVLDNARDLPIIKNIKVEKKDPVQAKRATEDAQDSAAAQVAALLALISFTGLLWFAGDKRYIADEAFAMDTDDPDEGLKAGDPVPEGVLPEADVTRKQVVDVPITYYQGGELKTAHVGSVIDAADVPQARGAVVPRWVAIADVTYDNPNGWLHYVPGQKVRPDLADLDAVKDHVHTEDTGVIADDHFSVPDPKLAITVKKDSIITGAQRAMPEFANHTEERWFATTEFEYYAGGKATALLAGAELPDEERAREAAKGHVEERRFAAKDLPKRVFAAGQPVPARFAEKPGAKVRQQGGVWLRTLVVGVDGRWSTSKAQALMWTYIVVFIFLSLLFGIVTLGIALDAAAVADGVTGRDFSDIDLPEPYYILLGGPFAAAILAKAFTTSKVTSGTLVKTEATNATGPAQGFRDLVSDDSGETDLVDFQYLLFNLLAAGMVLAAFIPHLAKGFPDVPEVVFGLTGASALAYTTKKAVERRIAVITSVTPRHVRPGDTIEISGSNLITGSGKLPRVEVGGRDAGTAERVNATGGTHALRVKVPAALRGESRAGVVVIPDGGAATDPVEIEFDDVTITRVAPQPIEIGTTTRIVVSGTGFSAPGDSTRSLTLGGVALNTHAWEPGQIIASLDPLKTYPTGAAVVLEVRAGEAVGTRTVAIEALRVDRVQSTPIELDAAHEIVVIGAGLDAEDLDATLDGKSLQIVSRAKAMLVLKLKPAILAQQGYTVSDNAILEVATPAYRASAVVKVKEKK